MEWKETMLYKMTWWKTKRNKKQKRENKKKRKYNSELRKWTMKSRLNKTTVSGQRTSFYLIDNSILSS